MFIVKQELEIFDYTRVSQKFCYILVCVCLWSVYQLTIAVQAVRSTSCDW